ncbi:conserved hypothetical protein [Microsporum canis CBS 113480]|uniref:FAD binding domain-containing protein n=1 Tax=Arthroderma otae (strain ATCC MYA-4605 / CBS 113480) TaxID=554155 RepID=C5G0W1_ARTOC|nr:conserved hypothetical protein [Microsporum canis CBS 113480]EEQ35764.1 conserved hypothetical protein [Microsporum canis CBS 113480]
MISLMLTTFAGFFVPLSIARTTESSPSCCSMLSEAFPDAVYTKYTQLWSSEKDNFWSATAVLDPACIFAPESTKQVSQAIKLFSQNECKFSIKGGGHSSIPGAASIDDGVMMFADGKVVNANRKENKDLFWALKGGNNNFGVVTHFDFNTVPTSGSVYGGLVRYPESSLDKVDDLVYDYHTRQAVDGTLTHAMPQWVYNGTSNDTYNLTPVVYNDNVEELPSILKMWLDIPHVSTTLERRTYENLSIHLNEGFGPGLIQEQRVFTVYADRKFYKDVLFQFRQWLQNYQDVPGFLGAHLNMPITPRQVEQGLLKGGNALGLEGAGNNTLGILFFGVTFKDPQYKERVLPEHDEFVRSMIELAKERGVLYPYIMLTYCGYNQAAIASYGPENVDKLWRVQREYDPKDVFQRLVPGGQKLPPQSK